MIYFYMLFGTLLFITFFLGTLYGSQAIAAQFMERFDTDTQKGVLLFVLLIVPVFLLSIVVGPFYAVVLAYRSLRKMPWS